VRTFAEDEDVFLATRDGKCVRFPVTDVRVFSGRTSTGVRGIRLADGDEVIFMAGLRHIETEVEVRDEYLKSVNAKRRLTGGDYTGRGEDLAKDRELAERLDDPVYQTMVEEEQFILTVTEDGFGKRSSSFDYRISKRGGKGIDAIDLKRGKAHRTRVVATLPAIESDQMVMVSDGGQLIRMPVDGISFVVVNRIPAQDHSGRPNHVGLVRPAAPHGELLQGGRSTGSVVDPFLGTEAV